MEQAKVLQQDSATMDEQIDHLIEEAWKALFEISVSIKLYRRIQEGSGEDPKLALVNSDVTILPNFDKNGDYLMASVLSKENVRLFDQIELGGFRFEVVNIGEKLKIGEFDYIEVTSKRLKK